MEVFESREVCSDSRKCSQYKSCIDISSRGPLGTRGNIRTKARAQSVYASITPLKKQDVSQINIAITCIHFFHSGSPVSGPLWFFPTLVLMVNLAFDLFIRRVDVIDSAANKPLFHATSREYDKRFVLAFAAAFQASADTQAKRRVDVSLHSFFFLLGKQHITFSILLRPRFLRKFENFIEEPLRTA